MKRIVALALAMLLLCGCGTVLPADGTLSLDANNVDHIKIAHGVNGKEFSVADREIISTVISHINSFTLENGQQAGDGYLYSVTLVSRLDGGAETYFAVISDEAFSAGGESYAVNAKDFRKYLEALECDTLTDNELIDTLLEGDTLDQLNILDDEGKLSLDKIIALPQSCPALFELISRPSSIASVGSYGVEKIEAYLNSSNPELVEKAKEWIEVLKNLMPEIQEKLENLIKNQENSENNP